ncbi:MAG: NAD-dependent epimerase/dehydratase family protein [Spirochaetales bacterium]|nr:NAD-dependent epimerase/dehydratase family protein [Spirochaetales bacterium]
MDIIKKTKKPLKIGLTGITGGVGRRLGEMLLERHFTVKALIRRTARVEGLSHKLHFVYGDIRDPSSLPEFVKDIDVCIHLAAQVAYTTKKEYSATNISGTENLCEAIIHHNPFCRLIYCSTISTLKVNPFFRFLSSPYAISKYLAEKKVVSYMEKNRLKATIIYPGLIYGGYDKSFLPQINRAILDGAIRFIRGGEHNAPVIYVDELCDLFIKAVLNEKCAGKRYISVKGIELGIHEIIRIIAGMRNISIPEKTSPKLPFFILAFIAELIFGVFLRGKKPPVNRTMVDVLSINFDNYKKRYDDPKQDLNWEQNTSKEFFIGKLNDISSSASIP